MNVYPTPGSPAQGDLVWGHGEAFIPVLVSAYDIGYYIGFALALAVMFLVLISPIVAIIWFVRRGRRQDAATPAPYYPQPAAVFDLERRSYAAPVTPRQPKFCRMCGTRLVENARFCEDCGTPISATP